MTVCFLPHDSLFLPPSFPGGNVKKFAALIATAAVALAACGSNDEATITMPTVAESAEAVVVGAWARNSPMAASVGAGYLVITSPIDDELLGIAVPAEIAARVELHETVAVESADDSDTSGHGDSGHGSMPPMAGGMMTMREVGSIELPAGKMVMLQPGGLHIMFLDLAGPLELGSSFTATLTFAVADPLEVTFEVRDTAP
jgi:copper(I)-binding protein